MDVEITELEKIDATRVDGVDTPANGIPILLMKAAGTGSVKCPTCKGDGKIMGNNRDCPDCGGDGQVTPAKAKQLAAKSLVRHIIGKAVDADGQVDEAPDIAGGTDVIGKIADLIIAECQEIKAGNAGEIADVQKLACAAEIVWCWRTGEEAVASGSVMPATALMQSAAKADMSRASINDLPDSAFAYIEPGGSKDSEGKTTPRSLRHFPVHDAAHARNALSRAPQSPFGEKAMPKIRAAAKKFGIDVSDDTSKSAIAEGEPAVDTETQETGSQIAKAVEDAVTKATAPLKDELALVKSELAKVKATPVPGGPMMSTPPRQQAQGSDVAKAAEEVRYFREMADSVSQDPNAADGYRQLARRAEDRLKTLTA